MNDPNKGLVDELRKEIEETHKQAKQAFDLYANKIADLQKEVVRLNRAVQLKSSKITGVLVILAVMHLLPYLIFLAPDAALWIAWFIEIVFWMLLFIVWSSNNEMDIEIPEEFEDIKK